MCDKLTVRVCRVFKAQNMVLSEGLVNKRLGRKRQTIGELITQFGGTTGGITF